MKMWDIATSNQAGRGLASFVGTMNFMTPPPLPTTLRYIVNNGCILLPPRQGVLCLKAFHKSMVNIFFYKNRLYS